MSTRTFAMSTRTIGKRTRQVATSIEPPSPRAVIAMAGIVTAASCALWPHPAHAVDGCLVLLCLAAPSWSAIPQCASPVRQLFRDLARGKPFPSCAMSGASSTAGNRWTSAPTFCPPQYTRVFDGESGPLYSCDYGGCVSVSIDGSLFARTWWSFGGDTVTEFTSNAKATLGAWDTRFDDDYARWLAMQPPPAPADTSSGS
jgi:hypothetical protein